METCSRKVPVQPRIIPCFFPLNDPQFTFGPPDGEAAQAEIEAPLVAKPVRVGCGVAVDSSGARFSGWVCRKDPKKELGMMRLAF